ncbi:MAG: hypothetical protein J2P45_13695 [Candidatus Dormibacteraeota bacterium]|nr:hypothetical protein [Candidatus Dormibacteraeota bacterium]
MRTLGTQVRVRRLLRLEGELLQQLLPAHGFSASRRTASRRLLQALGDVRDAWAADLRSAAGAGPGLDDLHRHVRRVLAALELQAAALERNTTDVCTFDREFREAAVPLLFLLRGVEDAGDQALLAWAAPEPLRRTA